MHPRDFENGNSRLVCGLTGIPNYAVCFHFLTTLYHDSLGQMTLVLASKSEIIQTTY